MSVSAHFSLFSSGSQPRVPADLLLIIRVAEATDLPAKMQWVPQGVPDDFQAANIFPLPCDTEKHVLQKLPSTNHQPGPPPPFPFSSPPRQPLLLLTPSQAPRKQLQWMPRVQQAGQRTPPRRGRGCVPGARTAAAAAASPLAS